MQFTIDEVPVYFPYPFIYPEQHAYMVHVKRLLDAGGVGLLEMPCGTGKTVSLLALITSYQLHHPGTGKLVYCSRTVPEVEAVLRELQRVVLHMQRCTSGDEYLHGQAQAFLGVGLSSRAQLCVNEEVNGANNSRDDTDSLCRARTAPWVVERVAAGEEGAVGCDFFDPEPPIGSGVWTLEEMRERGVKQGVCPYYWARAALRKAQVVVFSYQYVLHGDIFRAVTRPSLGNNPLVVFDEAHNMDSVCIESLTVRLGRRTLEDARLALSTLKNELQRVQEADSERLQREYQALLRGLRNEGVQWEEEVAGPQRGNDEASNEQENQQEEPQQEEQPLVPVPGAIRKGVHFLHLLWRLNEYLLLQLSGVSGQASVRVERPQSFLWRANADLSLPPVHALRFVASRLGSLLRTLQMAPSPQLLALRAVASLITLLASHTSGFAVISYPRALVPLAALRLGWDDGMLQLACLDASLAMRSVTQHFPTVVITSATLSPLAMFPKILQMRVSLMEELPMNNTRRCILPLVVCRGADQALLNTKYKNRTDPAMQRNYAALLCDLAQAVPDGMIVFFPSYGYMEVCVQAWHAAGLLHALLQHKLVFIETRGSRETAVALRSYQAACDAGRGAVLLCVARGKVSEGVDFGHHHGRCVVVIGLPFQYTKAPALLQRLQFMQDQHQVNQGEYLNFDALRQAAQCVGRVIRSKSDYSVMVFADSRYGFESKLSKLPEWIRRCVRTDFNNLSTDVAVAVTRSFIREMAQPWDPSVHVGKDLWTVDHIPRK